MLNHVQTKKCTCYAQDLRKLAVAPSAMVCKYVDINDNTIKEYSVKDNKENAFTTCVF